MLSLMIFACIVSKTQKMREKKGCLSPYRKEETSVASHLSGFRTHISVTRILKLYTVESSFALLDLVY